MLTAFAVGLGLTASLMAQVPSYVPTNGLVGWWPFNGNANDESGNGNNGTVNGATLTADRFGNANKAYSFNGMNQNILCNPIANVQSLTISLWLLIQNNGGGQFIVQNNISNCTNVNFTGHFGFNQNINFSHNAINCSTPGTNNFTMSSIDTAGYIGGWSHLVQVIDVSGNTKLYLNGILVDFSTSNLGFNFCPILNSTLRFGGPWWNQDLQWFKGEMDDIGIWNRELSQSEINTLYSGCGNQITSQPINSNINAGANAQFTVGGATGNSYQWQSNPSNYGWQNVPSNSTYSGGTTNTLTVSNVQLANHNQSFRVIASNGNCTDTSNIATIQIADTCITNVTVYDTLLTTVTDTLIINTTLSLPAPNNENTILIYPNPASDHITIDNGNYNAMAGYSIKIENNAGQQVFQSAINQAQFYVDLSTWTGNGLYFVHLIDPQNNTVTVRKIVLQ